MHDVEATRQTLEEWLNTINNVQERRRQEIDNAAEKCRSGEPRLPDEKGLAFMRILFGCFFIVKVFFYRCFTIS